MRVHARLLAASCAAWLLACDESSPPATGVCGEQGCSESCAQLAGDNCDILDEACRQRIFEAVVCVRGTPGEMPEVRTISQDEYRAEQESEADEDAGVDDVSEDTWSAALRLVGLIEADTTTGEASLDDRVANVAGYYSSTDGKITLVDRDQAEDSDSAQELLAHELVHALQDQEMGLYELADRTGRSSDSWLARSCLVEGEAVLYEELATSLLKGRGIDPGYWDVNLEWYLKYAHGELAIAPSPYAALWRLTYPVGGRFLTDAWLAGGNHAVQSVYWAVPQATIYWMQGYAAVLAREGQLVKPLACNIAAAPDGYAHDSDASLGAFAVYAALAQVSASAEIPQIGAAWQLALQWRQDSFTVFTSEEGGVAVSWRMLFEDEAAAAAVVAKLSVDLPEARGPKWIARGAEVEILAAEAGALVPDWEGTDPEACPVSDE